MGPIEHDGTGESVTATYDATRDSPSLAVVALVAAARGEDPAALPPLQEVVDTEALDKLSTESATGDGACDRISFRYDGFDVTVTGGDVIEAKLVETT